jgi:hypothetical protein
MAHPMAGQAKASEKRRLGALNAHAGKAWGSSQMYKKASYPKKNAGTDREFTIPGGKGRNRPDRMAAGGGVRKRRPHATTNIIISHAGGRGGSGGGGGAGPNPPGGAGPVPMPVPVNRPVPVPVGAGAAPAPPPVGAAPVVVRPPMPAAAPVRPPLPVGPPGMGGPPPGIRPPGMKKGGSVKLARGGSTSDPPGKAYKGFPHSPTTEVDDAVSAHKKGGKVKKWQSGGGIGQATSSGVGVEDDASGYRKGGAVKKRQFGGGMGGMDPMSMSQAPGGGQAPPGVTGGGLLGPGPGRAPTPPIQGPPTISGRPARPAMPLTVPMPPTLGSRLSRPAPGTTVGYKKGGEVHSDEAEDKKLIKRMLKQEDKAGKRASGGVVNPGHNQKARGLLGSKYYNEGRGYADGGVVNTSGGAAGGLGRLRKTKLAAKVPDKTEA